MPEAQQLNKNTTQLKLSEIIKHRDLQIRDKLDMQRVEFLEDVSEGWDALLVYKVDSKYYLADGFHRITAAERKMMATVNCEIVEGTFQDAYIAAVIANSVHRGLPLTSQERKHAAESLLKLHTNWSNGKLAKITGVGETSVRRWRTEMEKQGIIQSVEKVIGINGVEQAVERQFTETITSGEKIEPKLPPWGGKILCPSDCLDVLPNEAKQSYDLILTDPPYNITDMDGDKFESLESYLEFTNAWLLKALPLLKPTGRLYVCFSYQRMLDALPVMREVVEKINELYNFTFGCPIVWYHPNTISAAHNRKEYKPAYDFIFYWYGPEAPDLIADDAYTGDERANVWRLDEAAWNIAVPQSNYREGKFHKFQKPLALIDRIIKGSTRVGDKVLDPFGGSGTTAVACVQLGRDYKIIEKDERHLSVIEERLGNVYGKDTD